ncbi:MAG: M48 family metalloprotease [Phycisphaerae bacterium]
MSKFYNNIKTGFLLASLTALILVAGYLIGGGTGIIIALVFASFGNMIGWFFSDRIALAAMSAKEVGQEHMLYRITERLAQNAGMPMPKVYISPQQAPNAFATGRSPNKAAVCATEGLMQMLSPNEIAGVMAHELAHVKHRDTLIQAVAATIGGAISAIAYFALFFGGSRENQNPFAAILVLILGPLAAGLLQMAISRSREFAADTEGAAICGDPMYLATALEKVHHGNTRIPTNVNPAFNALMIAEPMNLRGGSVSKLFSTHPPLAERLENLIGRPSVR